MKHERKQWDVNDFAFIIYASRKGLKGSQIAQSMEISKSAYYQISMKLSRPAKLSPKQQKALHKAEVLAQEVLAGVYKDTRTLWDNKIENASGLHFTYPEVKPETECVTVTPEADEKLSLFEFSVNVSTLKKIIQIIKG